MKIDDHGKVLWSKTYGGVDEDFAYSVESTTDSGYIVAGGAKSFATGGFCDILCNDVYLIKTDENGDTLWTKAYGSLGEERGWSVRATSDGGYVIAGITTGFGNGPEDFYFIKTDADGNTGCAEKGTLTLVDHAQLEVKLDGNGDWFRSHNGDCPTDFGYPCYFRKDLVPGDSSGRT